MPAIRDGGAQEGTLEMPLAGDECRPRPSLRDRSLDGLRAVGDHPFGIPIHLVEEGEPTRRRVVTCQPEPPRLHPLGAVRADGDEDAAGTGALVPLVSEVGRVVCLDAQRYGVEDHDERPSRLGKVRVEEWPEAIQIPSGQIVLPACETKACPVGDVSLGVVANGLACLPKGDPLADQHEKRGDLVSRVVEVGERERPATADQARHPTSGRSRRAGGQRLAVAVTG